MNKVMKNIREWVYRKLIVVFLVLFTVVFFGIVPIELFKLTFNMLSI